MHWLYGEETHELFKIYGFMTNKYFREENTRFGYGPFERRIPMGKNKKGYYYRLYDSTAQFVMKILLERFNAFWDEYSIAEQIFCEIQCAKHLKTNLDWNDNEEAKVTETIVHKEWTEPDPYKYNGELCKFVGSGLKRNVYISICGKYVIKVPKNALGYEENKTEAEIYKSKPNNIYAKCELLDNGLLKMEYVKHSFLNKGDDYPEWVSSIAEGQVGINLEGKLVAYDYGSDI